MVTTKSPFRRDNTTCYVSPKLSYAKNFTTDALSGGSNPFLIKLRYSKEIDKQRYFILVFVRTLKARRMLFSFQLEAR